ncbi:MAG: hypothetical protein ACXWNW_14175 [Isosphaeraceae bacterium]
MSAQPFVDFRAKILTVPPSQQAVIVGKSNLAMVESGLVKWDDVVTPSRIRSLREVVSRKRLTVDQMVGSGVTRGRAEEAWNAVHTGTHTASEANRAKQVKALLGKGYTRQQIVDAAGRAIGSRIGIVEGPSGPGLIPPSKILTPRPVPKIAPRVAALVASKSAMKGSGGIAEGLAFDRSERATNRKDVLIKADVARVEESLAKDTGFHVGQGGKGESAVKGRYEQAREFIEKAKADGTPVNAIELSLGKDDGLHVEDGRHRFAVLRDLGATLIPVAVPKDQAAKFRQLYSPIEPVKADEEGRIHLSAPAMVEFVKGMVKRLAEKFGITYKD